MQQGTALKLQKSTFEFRHRYSFTHSFPAHLLCGRPCTLHAARSRQSSWADRCWSKHHHFLTVISGKALRLPLCPCLPLSGPFTTHWACALAVPAPDPDRPGSSSAAGCGERKWGLFLNGSPSLQVGPVRMLQPTCSQSSYTKKPRVSMCLESAGSSGEVDGGYPGRETPQDPPLHTHNSSWGLSPRTNDSVCGRDHGIN